MYKLIKNTMSGEVDVVLNTQTGGYIPMNPDNTDYQAYLKWLADGNTPAQPDVEVVPTSPLPAENS